MADEDKHTKQGKQDKEWQSQAEIAAQNELKTGNRYKNLWRIRPMRIISADDPTPKQT